MSTVNPDMFLKVPGAPGECKDTSFKNQIALLGFTFYVYNNSSQGHGQGQGAGRGSMSPIDVELIYCSGVATLRKMSGQGTIVDNVIISKIVNDKLDEEITLIGAKFIQVAQSHQNGGMTDASATIVFREAKVKTYKDNDVTGIPEVHDTTTYNLAENSVS